MENTTKTRIALLAGATSATGVAIAHALEESGVRVLAVGSNQQRLDERLDFVAARYRADLGDEAEVAELVEKVHAEHGSIDLLLHLVGGWRGGKGITGQSDEDYQFLHHSVMTTLRHTSRAFHQDLLDSPAGRLAIISSQSVANPTPSNANYGSVKAAAEHWVRAVARDFAKRAPQAAAVIWVAKALTAERPAAPGSKLAGFTHVQDVAAAALRLLPEAAASANGQRIDLPALD